MFLLSIIFGLYIKRFSTTVVCWWGAYSITVPLVLYSLAAVSHEFNSSTLKKELILGILSAFLMGMGIMYCVYKLKEYFKSEKVPEAKTYTLQDPSSKIFSPLNAPKNESESNTLEKKGNKPLTHQSILNAENPKHINVSSPSEWTNNSLTKRKNTIKNNTPIQTIYTKESIYLNINYTLFEKGPSITADIGLNLSAIAKMFLIRWHGKMGCLLHLVLNQRKSNGVKEWL